mgnify:CR=1 FL=1|tara:strand:+ start:2045 stop:2269 length:225 start_codon:yes stop_codon:yes gene_type:complete
MGGAVKAIASPVKSIFSSPKAPAVPAAPKPKKVEAKALVKKKRGSEYGRAGTILTSAQGIEEEADIVRKTLLGA